MKQPDTGLRPEAVGAILLRAYPDQLVDADPEQVYWRDGAAMAIVGSPGGIAAESGAVSLAQQLAEPYPLGDSYVFAEYQSTDAGRMRCMPFFQKMYGASKEAVEQNLVPVQWMPKSRNRRIMVTKVNGVDRQLAKVSSDLERLPRRIRKVCEKVCGTFNWRTIAGSDQLSAHAFGIAIDINAELSNYWQWDLEKHGAMDYVNRFPQEVVAVFERHGFIWGGKWKHYDTMHFEYRPELLAAANPKYQCANVLLIGRKLDSYGADRQLRALAVGLSPERYCPVVVHTEASPGDGHAGDMGEVECVHLPMRAWRKFSNILVRYFDAIALLEFAQARDIRIIHCSYQWLLPYALFVGQKMGVPVIGHIRRPNNGVRKLRSLGAHRCDAVLAISNRIRAELDQLSELHGKVHLVTDMVDLPRLDQSGRSIMKGELGLAGQFVFGLVGRIYKSKRQLDFAKAAQLLLSQGHEAHFAIIGRVDDADYYEELLGFLNENALTDRVHLLGHRDDVKELLPSLDVLVSLSGGSIMYEAMAAGRTVISAGFTKPEDSTHLVDGVNALVTESKEVDVLVGLMRRTLLEPELRQRLGRTAQTHAESGFSAAAMVRATESVYARLCPSDDSRPDAPSVCGNDGALPSNN